jgi:hypothetical protein
MEFFMANTPRNMNKTNVCLCILVNCTKVNYGIKRFNLQYNSMTNLKSEILTSDIINLRHFFKKDCYEGFFLTVYQDFVINC